MLWRPRQGDNATTSTLRCGIRSPEYRDLRPSLPSTMTATGTFPRAAPLAGLSLAVLVAVLGLAGKAPAAIDLATKVRVDLVVRPAVGGGAPEAFLVGDGGVLRTGDGVQLRLASDADAYVYVVAFGSSNTAILLHPFSGRPADALVRQGQTKTFPEPGLFLPLDGREGRETLFTIVAATPLEDISDLLATLARAAVDADTAAEIIREAYPRVRRLTFKHIGAKPLVGVAGTLPRSPVGPAASAAMALGSPTAGFSERESDRQSPATGGWSGPSAEGSGTAEPTTATPSVSAGSAGATASAGIVRDGRPEAEAARVEESDGADQVSPALREARRAAGIDERVFRGILATLPGSDDVEVPTAFRRSTKEQGVLSGQGSRLRGLDSVQREPDGDSATKTQN